MWDPHLLKDVDLLESVQKFALNLCCKQWSSPYQDLLDISKLSSLQARQEVARLGFMYKLVHNLVDFLMHPSSTGLLLLTEAETETHWH